MTPLTVTFPAPPTEKPAPPMNTGPDTVKRPVPSCDQVWLPSAPVEMGTLIARLLALPASTTIPPPEPPIRRVGPPAPCDTVNGPPPVENVRRKISNAAGLPL